MGCPVQLYYFNTSLYYLIRIRAHSWYILKFLMTNSVREMPYTLSNPFVVPAAHGLVVDEDVVVVAPLERL